MTRFHAAFEQLFANEDNDQQRVKRSHGQGDMHKILKYLQVPLRLNPGAFIRKATNRGYHKNDYSTYWTYHGSLTTPSKDFSFRTFRHSILLFLKKRTYMVNADFFDEPLTYLSLQLATRL